MKTLKAVGITFSIVGLAFVGAGLFLWLGPSLVFGRTSKTMGTVVDYVTSRSDGTLMYAAVVTYVPADANRGEGYRVTDGVNTSWRPYDLGERVVVRYNPDDPSSATVGEGIGVLGWVMLGMGTLFAGIGGGLLLRGVWQRRKRERLLRDGRRVVATVTDFRLNRFIRVNNHHPWRVYATYAIDGGRGSREVQSDNLYFDVREVLALGDEVEVYLDRREEGQYWMAVGEPLGLRQNPRARGRAVGLSTSLNG